MMMNFDYLALVAGGPMIGLLLTKVKKPNLKRGLLFATILLLLPGLKGYFFAHSIINYALYAFLIALLWDLTLHSVKQSTAVITSGVTSGIALCLVLLVAAFYGFIGTTEQKNQWQKDNYEIRYYESRGFAGTGHSKYYDLHHSAVFGIYTKKLQRNTSSSFDTTNICPLNYKKHGVIFNKCTHEFQIKND
jgi:hypothetical protein